MIDGAPVNVLDFGAVGDGVTNDTAAFQAAVDYLTGLGGGTMVIPSGTFLTDTIIYPYDPVIINTIGLGVATSIWQMRTATNPIIKMKRTTPNARMTGARFSNFGVKANASCSPANLAHIAIDTIGFDAVEFDKIKYFANGAGSVGILFYTASHPQLTYQQRFTNIISWGNSGPGYVIRTGFDADPAAAVTGTSYLRNTNLIHVDGFWIYSNSNMISAFDMSCATKYEIANGLIESVTGDGIILGQAGHIEDVWLENITGAPLSFQNTRSVTSSSNTISNAYLSGFGGVISIPTSCTNNVLRDISGGVHTVTRADPLGGNILSNTAALGGKSTITKTFGGALSVGIAERAGTGAIFSRADGMWVQNYFFTPAALGSFGFSITPPTGYAIKRLAVSAYDAANGVAILSAVGYPLTSFIVTCTNANTVDLCVQVAYE